MSRQRREARRDFLKKFTATLAGGTAMSFFPQLRLMEAALAQAAPAGAPDYRALVCLYLGGGNDAFNWLIPSDTTRYNVYSTSRGGVYSGTNGPLGIAQANLLGVNLSDANGNPLAGGATYGLHPACADWDGVRFDGSTVTMRGLRSLTNQGRVAWLANIGTLVDPVTKATFNNPSVRKPPQLYSHNDQTNLWYQGRETGNYRYGWGGQVADLLFGLNAPIQGTNPPILLPMNISFAGTNKFQVGEQVFPYQMSSCGNPNAGNAVAGQIVGTNFANCSGTSGLNNFRGCSVSGLNVQEQALCSLLNTNYTHDFELEHAVTMRRAMNLSAEIAADIAGTANNLSLLQTPFRALADNVAVPGYNAAADGGNSAAEQLAMVARLIKQRVALGQQRNIFFVNIGGFDTHATQMPDNGQPRLLRRVSRALGAFYTALEEMGLENSVTTFTMSEFARTLNSNGDGSDHGWGGIQMVMGGSVRGGRLYGTWPDMALNSPDCFSRGQMIPTTAMDQLAASLAGWMGLSAGQLATIFPNLSNFSGGALPILNPAP